MLLFYQMSKGFLGECESKRKSCKKLSITRKFLHDGCVCPATDPSFSSWKTRKFKVPIKVYS